MKTNAFVIFTGDSKLLTLAAKYQDSQDPLDLSTCTEIAVTLPLASGLTQTFLLSLAQVSILGSPLLGKFTVQITSLISVLLNPDEEQDIDVTFTIGGAPFTVRYYRALTVILRD